MPPQKSSIRRIPPSVPHYYGDVVRTLMICGVGLGLFAATFSTDYLHDVFPMDVVVGLVIVAFAALTNPLRAWVTAVDALLSGLAAATFEVYAFNAYKANDLTTFVLYQGVAVLFIFAFYFSLKTLRAFMLHQIGRPDSMPEFRSARSSSEEQAVENPLEAEQSFEIPPKYN